MNRREADSKIESPHLRSESLIIKLLKNGVIDSKIESLHFNLRS
jgi:hypothetical protein